MKRFFDIVFCLIIIFILSPLILLIALSIKLETKGSTIFLSKRVGVNNLIFTMPKFRTMLSNTEIVETNKLKNTDARITKVGKILRKYSLDELPQLFSVIQGKMTLVGPRPALPSQNELLEKRQKLGIHRIKPGITGYAQINGRDMISLDKKIDLEYEYLKNRNLFFDLKIIFKTIIIIFNQKGILH